MFADAIPEHWGNIGRAMLTLFVMLTLENFPNYMYEGMDVHPWSWIYFVSFILIAAFIVLNVLIGIVLNSMEEAREAERRKSVQDKHPERAGPVVDLDASAPVSSASRCCGQRWTSSRWSSQPAASPNRRPSGTVEPA